MKIQRSDKQSELPFSQDPKKRADLGFGQHFSDHWFLAHYHKGQGWTDPEVRPYGPLALNPAASVFHYGQALFEGMKAFRREDGSIWLYRPDFNFERINEGAARLCLPGPTKEIFFNGLRALLEVDSRWVPPQPGCALYLRPTLIGTEGFLGVRPSNEAIFYILLSPVGSYYSEGTAAVKIWVEEKALRAAPGGLGATKAGANYAASLQAALAAKAQGYAQVLWLDVERDGIEEVGTMNVFFVFKNEIVTPALNGSILPGGVRDSVLQLLRAQKANVVERRITIHEVVERFRQGELLEAFGTGTAAVISPIGELNYRGQPLQLSGSSGGALSQELLRTLQGVQMGTQADPYGWMVPLEKLTPDRSHL